MPRVSVIIPSYNHANYIGEAVESVLGQVFSDLELIVVDDGSKDHSLEVLAGYTDPRLTVITQENQGAHAAINRGLHIASGEYLAILNSDDVYYPYRLEKACMLLDSDPRFALVGSHIEIIDSAGKGLGYKHGYADAPPWLLEKPEQSFRASKDIRLPLLTENYFATTSNYVFPHRFFEQAGDFIPLRYAHDWDFALRLSRLGTLALIPEFLLRYRVHATNTIRENQAAMIFEICWILAVHLPAAASERGFFPESTAAGLTAPEVAIAKRIDQLLNSIYVFGMEKVLTVLLLQKLNEKPEQALSLLDPDNPGRRVYIQMIIDTLAVHDQVPSPSRRG
jgi:glycosyltransferase involved in cell wall biosynthesis